MHRVVHRLDPGVPVLGLEFLCVFVLFQVNALFFQNCCEQHFVVQVGTKRLVGLWLVARHGVASGQFEKEGFRLFHNRASIETSSLVNAVKAHLD